MGISPFKRGDYVRVKPEYFSKELFDHTTGPLKLNEIGLVTGVSTSGDSRPRYVQLNGKPPLYHYSLFEETTPWLLGKVYFRTRYILKWR